MSKIRRAVVAARIATLRQGRQSRQLADLATQEEAAELLNVGERSVQRLAVEEETSVTKLMIEAIYLLLETRQKDKKKG